MRPVNHTPALTARDLMTDEVVGITSRCSVVDAEEWLLDQGFDVAPVMTEGEYVAPDGPAVVDGDAGGYITLQALQAADSAHSVTDVKRHITMTDLIDPQADFTAILEALFYRHWYFIGFQSGIDGILTRADLNKPLVSTYFYTRIYEFETQLRELILALDITWEHILGDKADPPAGYSYQTYLDEVEEYYQDSVARDLELQKIQYTTLTHLREIVRHSPKVQEALGINADQIHDIKELRNDVAHPNPKNILTLTVDPDEKPFIDDGHRTIGDLDDIHFDLLAAIEALNTVQQE